MAQTEDKEAPITIKKYANRRLYNTATSSYVTLDHLAQMVKEGTQFAVFDAKSGDEITRSVLTQIIVEEEAKGQNLLPVSFLRHLISFYGDSLQGLVPSYLEQSMQSFATNQEKMRDYMKETMGGLNPFGSFEEMNKQNMVMFENAMRMFAPQFYKEGEHKEADAGQKIDEKPSQSAEKAGDDLEKMKAQLEAMQQQLSKLSQK
ncbi:polyhydroxyalkanoate synthesis repressor PhaR [Terasakiella brassicae]|uniref:Polyhydroxyalkanoate synthesis repressor PhaR n=1 Tax=Terasakiella brassicae TaxID=1634917 RepID=A0A917C449_9PROT|nr:polyhydroxyalkanoate synthesis repressor PhaR [Terasakiella brassicae]GGF68001.1 polyhydroxyalkanoate synthesis repressor PhaR [Terasakiella brassicae]